MAYALSALPKISDTERMARFMAALQESRPRASLAPAASHEPPVLHSSHSTQLLHGLSELWGTPPTRQVAGSAHLSSRTSQASGSGKASATHATNVLGTATGPGAHMSLCSLSLLWILSSCDEGSALLILVFQLCDSLHHICSEWY